MFGNNETKKFEEWLEVGTAKNPNTNGLGSRYVMSVVFFHRAEAGSCSRNLDYCASVPARKE
jgi:hypothetical protein